MDLRVIVLTADPGLSDLIRAQIENLGCRASVAGTYEDATAVLDWADAAVVDLAGNGLDDMNRLRVEGPRIRVLAVATEPDQEEAARSAGAAGVLVEPFSIADVVDAVRALVPSTDSAIVDLRTGERVSAPAVEDDTPWWATRSH
jgi:DNA-binding response OmpR family regulator